MTTHPGWLLVIAGLILAAIGLVWIVAPHVPWLGHLPGDIVIERGRTRVYFPITTCILLSLLLSGLLWAIRHFFR
jgi:hypothetical protein